MLLILFLVFCIGNFYINDSLSNTDTADNQTDNINIDTKNIDELFNAFFLAINSGKYQEAVEYMDKTLAIDPNNIGAYNNKALVLDKTGRYQEAIENYDKALAIDPNSPATLYNKGLALLNLNKY